MPRLRRDCVHRLQLSRSGPSQATANAWKRTTASKGPILKGASLGCGDEGVSGDMGFEPDTPSSPRPSNPPRKQKRPAESPSGMHDRSTRRSLSHEVLNLVCC